MKGILQVVGLIPNLAIIALLVLLFSLTSCSGSPEQQKHGKKVRVYRTEYNPYSDTYRKKNDVVYIRYVDSLSKSGDIVQIGNEVYIIE